MADITITITADEDDLHSASMLLRNHLCDFMNRTGSAIAAVLPKPRIHPKPGDALRRKSDGRIGWWTVDPRGVAGPRWENDDFGGIGTVCFDPDEWEIVTAAELAELFDRKRGA